MTRRPDGNAGRLARRSGPLFSRDGVIRVEAIEAMPTTMVELKAQTQRMPAGHLDTTEFTPIRL